VPFESKRNPTWNRETASAVLRGVALSINLIVLACLCGCTAQHAQNPKPAATLQRVEKVAIAKAAAGVRPARLPSPKPQPTIAIPRRAPDAPPEIVAVDVNSTSVHSGGVLWGKVLTSSNVASVEVRVATYGIGLKKIGVGRFALTYRLGYIPFFVRGTYPMHIIARNTRGDAVDRTLPLTIQ
jgi:hypothetical protein